MIRIRITKESRQAQKQPYTLGISLSNLTSKSEELKLGEDHGQANFQHSLATRIIESTLTFALQPLHMDTHYQFSRERLAASTSMEWWNTMQNIYF